MLLSHLLSSLYFFHGRPKYIAQPQNSRSLTVLSGFYVTLRILPDNRKCFRILQEIASCVISAHGPRYLQGWPRLSRATGEQPLQRYIVAVCMFRIFSRGSIYRTCTRASSLLVSCVCSRVFCWPARILCRNKQSN